MVALPDIANALSRPPPKTKIKTTILVPAETNPSQTLLRSSLFFLSKLLPDYPSTLSLNEDKVWCYSCDSVHGPRATIHSPAQFHGEALDL